MPQYHAIVRDLAHGPSMPMPRLYVAPEPPAERLRHRPQPRPRRGLRDRGHPECSTWEELQGVLAHELSHVAQPRHPHRLGRRRGGDGHHVRRPDGHVGAIFGGGGRDRDDNILGSSAMAILAPVAAALLQTAL